MSKNTQRGEAVRSTVERIRNVEAQFGITKFALEQIQSELQSLAQHDDWFTKEEFPPPSHTSSDTSMVYRISEDEQTNRFALYIQTAISPTNTPAHNHDTWAVIAGIRGEELNRFYKRSNGGVEQTGSHVVRPGTGVQLLPEELHSIHITDVEPVINFHMYGLGLEYLIHREYYDRKNDQWKVYVHRDNIIDFRHVAQ